MNKRDCLIIINPAAARARSAWPTIRARLDESGIVFELHETKTPGDATSISRQALESGFRLIGVVGGDGTLSEAVAGYFRESKGAADDSLQSPINSEAALAVLPCGTGDDFARNLMNRRAPLE